MTFTILMVLMCLGVPLAVVMGLGGLYYMSELGNPNFLRILPQMMISGIYKFPLMAIPFFVMAGIIMSRARITDGIVRFAQLLVGSVRGGLAYVNILANMLLAGVSGSAVADAAAIGPILIPAMERDGYPKVYAAALTASSAIMGPIIPPSLIAIIYASTVSGVSVAALFAAGIVPGILIASCLCGIVFLSARKHNFPISRTEPVTLKLALNICWGALPSLAMPGIILGGILCGICTATEAGAVAIIYSIILLAFREHDLTWKDVPGIMMETATISAVVYLLIGTSMILQWVIGKEHLAEVIAAYIADISTSRYFMLTVIALVVLAAGMVLDTSPAILIFAPLLLPIAQGVGIDGLHFAMIMIIGLAVGLVTPPVGMCLFVCSSVANLSFNSLCSQLKPFLYALAIAFIIIVYMPQASIWLPRFMGY